MLARSSNISLLAGQKKHPKAKVTTKNMPLTLPNNTGSVLLPCIKFAALVLRVGLPMLQQFPRLAPSNKLICNDKVVPSHSPGLSRTTRNSETRTRLRICVSGNRSEDSEISHFTKLCDSRTIVAIETLHDPGNAESGNYPVQEASWRFRLIRMQRLECRAVGSKLQVGA